MFGDRDDISLKIGDTVLTKDGCLSIIQEFIVSDLVTEAVCIDKLSLEIKIFQLRDLLKI